MKWKRRYRISTKGIIILEHFCVDILHVLLIECIAILIVFLTEWN